METSHKGVGCDNLKRFLGGQGHKTAFKEDGIKKLHILVLIPRIYAFFLSLFYIPSVQPSP